MRIGKGLSLILMVTFLCQNVAFCLSDNSMLRVPMNGSHRMKKAISPEVVLKDTWKKLLPGREKRIPLDSNIRKVKVRLGEGCLYIRFSLNYLTMIDPTPSSDIAVAVEIIPSLDEEGINPLLYTRYNMQLRAEGEVRKEGDICTIGRASENDIVVDDPRISKKHVQIEMRKGNIIIRDLGSTNWTFVKVDKAIEYKGIFKALSRLKNIFKRL